MGPVIGILDHLLRLSPLLFTNAYCVFQYDSDEEQDCKALVAVLTGSRIAGSSFNEGLKRLAERLEAIAPPSNWLGVLRALAAIHDCAGRCTDREWAQWRGRILAVLGRLADVVFARSEWEPAVKPVIEGLAELLPRGTIPGDEETLEDRKRWIESTRQHLEAQRDPFGSKIPGHHPWREHLGRLLYHTHRAIQEILRREREHVLLQVRPRLELLSVVREAREGRQFVQLRLKTFPEGNRQLHDVSVLFDSEGENGLLDSGERSRRTDELVYPEDLGTRLGRPTRANGARPAAQGSGPDPLDRSFTFPHAWRAPARQPLVPRARERA